MRESRVMPSPQFVAGALIAVGVVLAFFGFLNAAACDGGYLLAYLGIAAILIGSGVALLGGTLVIIPTGILGVILLILGWHFASGVPGCGF